MYDQRPNRRQTLKIHNIVYAAHNGRQYLPAALQHGGHHNSGADHLQSGFGGRGRDKLNVFAHNRVCARSYFRIFR